MANLPWWIERGGVPAAYFGAGDTSRWGLTPEQTTSQHGDIVRVPGEPGGTATPGINFTGAVNAATGGPTNAADVAATAREALRNSGNAAWMEGLARLTGGVDPFAIDANYGPGGFYSQAALDTYLNIVREEQQIREAARAAGVDPAVYMRDGGVSTLPDAAARIPTTTASAASGSFTDPIDALRALLQQAQSLTGSAASAIEGPWRKGNRNQQVVPKALRNRAPVMQNWAKKGGVAAAGAIAGPIGAALAYLPTWLTNRRMKRFFGTDGNWRTNMPTQNEEIHRAYMANPAATTGLIREFNIPARGMRGF